MAGPPPRSTMSPPSSKLHRAIPASIFVFLGVFCCYLMDIPGMIINFPSPSATGFIAIPDTTTKIQILDKFHTIPFLDLIFRDVTVGFAPAGFGYDDVSRWQMFNFYGDIGVLYLIWLAESLRGGNVTWVVRFPAVLMTIAQLGGGGLCIPLYYFCHIVFCPPVRLQSPVQRRIALDDLLVLLPIVLVLHYAVVWGMLFNPSLDARHYWTWFWQLWIVRGSIAYYGVVALRKIIPFPSLSSRLGYRATVIAIFAPLIAAAAAVWIYTLINCPYELHTVFLPQPLVQDLWVARLRRVLQFDQLFVGGASLLWVVWMVWDMKRAGLVGLGTVWACAFATVVLWGAVGPGAAFGLLWVWREGVLAGDERGRKIE